MINATRDLSEKGRSPTQLGDFWLNTPNAICLLPVNERSAQLSEKALHLKGGRG